MDGFEAAQTAYCREENGFVDDLKRTRVVRQKRPRQLCRRQRKYLWAFSAIFLVSSGCLSGDYTRRMEATIKKLQAQGEKAAAVFAQASPVYDAAGGQTGISFRLPVFVGSNPKLLKSGEANAQPPFVALPGFAYGYEIPSAKNWLMSTSPP